MKRIIIVIIFIVLLLLVYALSKPGHIHPASAPNRILSKKTVVIDAGHGGKDAGTIGIDGTNEKEINLSVALKLRDYLMVSGINAVMVREGDNEFYPEGTDTNLSDLYNRLALVNEIPDAVLISVHQNHFEDEREWGTQIWYAPHSPESKELADGILTNIKSLLQPDNTRENKESDAAYYILWNATVPSVMVECGFMSNREENDKLKDTIYQCDMAYAILTGICEDV